MLMMMKVNIKRVRRLIGIVEKTHSTNFIVFVGGADAQPIFDFVFQLLLYLEKNRT